MSPRRLVIPSSRARRVLSPARLELLSAIGLHGPCTARDLATRVGRSVTSLYHHLHVLERAGAIARQQRGKEQLFRALAEEVTVGPRRSAAASASAAASVKAALRLTGREIEAALRHQGGRGGPVPRRLIALRSKAWLDRRQLREIGRHFDAILGIARRAESARRGAAIHAVTLALVPVTTRKAGAP